MKKLLGTIIILFFVVCAHAQTVLSGKVVNDHNHPLAGAVITFRNDTSLQKTISDEKGDFAFSIPVLARRSILSVHYIGMQPYQKTLSFSRDSNFLIVMLPDDITLEPLEVRAIRASERAPFTKLNIGKKELEKLNLGQDIPFILDQTPSVTTTSDAGNGIGYTGIRIRGTDATGINVTLNGIPYNDAESQLTYFVNLPDFTSSVQSVQVERGVGTSTNGAGAFGATINLSTNEVIKEAYAESNNTFGSFNSWKNTIKAGTGLLNNHFTADMRISKISSDGYIDRAFSDLKSLYFSTAYLREGTSLRFNLFTGKEKTYQSWFGVPERLLETDRTYNPAGTEKPGDPYNNQTDNYQQDHYQLFFNHDFSASLKMNLANYLTRGRGYYEEYKAAQKFSKYGLPNLIIGNETITSTDLIRDRWLDNRFYGQIFSLQYRNDAEEVTVGGSWSKYDGKHFGNVIWAEYGIENDYQYYRLAAKKTDANIYAKWLHRFDGPLSLFADLQYRKVDYEMKGFKDNPNLFVARSFDFLNPKAGLSWQKNGWTVYGSYALAHREPNRDDYEAGVREQPTFETLHDIETGIEKKNNNYSWAATFYYMYYQNQLVLTGQINDVGSYTRRNVPASFRIGIELSGGYNFSKMLTVKGNVAFSRNKIEKFTEYVDNWDNGKQESFNYSNTDISFSPSVVGSAVVNINPTEDLQISIVGKGVGNQYLDNTQHANRILNGYYRQDVQLSYRLTDFLFKEWNFILSVHNVFNRKYESNGFTYPYYFEGKLINENSYYPMAGTNFLFGINLKL